MRSISLEPGRDRHHHPIVGTLAKRLAPLGSDSDDLVEMSIDANLLANRVGAAQQVLADIGTDHYHWSRVVEVGIVDGAAHVEVQVVDAGHAWRPAADHRVSAALRSVDDLAIEVSYRGADDSARSAILHDGIVLLHGHVFALISLDKLIGVGDHVAHLADDEHVRAKIENLLGNIAVNPALKSHHRDHSGDADHDSQQSEERPQLIRP